ncbi:2-keto-4-pentenoate hydratase/2-oxohepta-3-ene-1,7-dioic acid hydratase (catechol pathway) [Paraburkholderia steynii]|uniref:2-keto-4-pentenoate hydratase/2-oxohepta-3-ene-1,7-dioic acid hydratase (Catechol pathway) n=1 Tax=Paraburkholderia steynii TaxID=1245441 RepID=A0A7Z7BBC3_9BURK|nr:fumarylacetoacetate hydrolase family protein [Paraburkholderia steynii]SDI55701.1 2-keto-4-pentenoate hydratase/2-oxohepta-3-ene-1,7-dioic acid hydratase (catechol pathway) [Paraburkholderia steynii]
MKICWFNENRLGVVAGDQVCDVTTALNILPAVRYPAPFGDMLVAHLDAIRLEIERLQEFAVRYPIEDVSFLSPVANPSKIIGVPVNYPSHVQEAKDNLDVFKHYEGGVEDQGLFLKANSSLVGSGQGVRLRFPERQTHHEIELGVVIGKSANCVSEADALLYIAGYAIALDMTVRGKEDRSLRKSVDSYSVLGPWLTTADEIASPQTLDLCLSVNGTLRQQSNTRNMLMGIARQIAWASTFYTLLPGDIIMTGTCEGVGRVLEGDVMDASIDGLGSMSVKVLMS